MTIYGKNGLKERGWTDAMIKKFAPKPIEFKTNPFYKKAAKVAIYSAQEVATIEERDDFIAYREPSERRKISAQKAISTKCANTMEAMQPYIDALRPPKKVCEEQLCRNARKQKAHHRGCAEYEVRIETRDIVNYIRHNLIPGYDEDVWACKGRVGVNDAYMAYKSAVMELIFSVYPEYRYEWMA